MCTTRLRDIPAVLVLLGHGTELNTPRAVAIVQAAVETLCAGFASQDKNAEYRQDAGGNWKLR